LFTAPPTFPPPPSSSSGNTTSCPGGTGGTGGDTSTGGSTGGGFVDTRPTQVVASNGEGVAWGACSVAHQGGYMPVPQNINTTLTQCCLADNNYSS
jgi:hypothetical protein